MAAKDFFHEAVRNALIKDGWNITHDPMILGIGGVDLFIDLGAEKLIAATKGDSKIAIEVKTFRSGSPVSEYHRALGQFFNYRQALEDSEPERELFLAIPEDIYQDFFQLPFIQESTRRHNVKLILYLPESEEIVKWIK
jgi:hypothetical protein